MQRAQKKNKNFKRNLFFFFLFIVLAGITFYPLDQRQSYLPNAQVEQPTFAPIGDCVANQNCPSGEPTQSPVTTAPSQPVTANTDIMSILIQLIQELLNLLRGTSNCSSISDYSYETDASMVMSDNAYTDDGRKWGKKGKYHKKWGKKKKWGLSKRKCKPSGGQMGTPTQPGTMPTPTQSVTPQPTEGAGGQMSCGNPGNPGNELGVGKYCTKGGGECQGTQSPYCALDFKTGVPGICSKPCASNADCGSGAVCSGSGLERGCEPTSCGTTTQ